MEKRAAQLAVPNLQTRRFSTHKNKNLSAAWKLFMIEGYRIPALHHTPALHL